MPIRGPCSVANWRSNGAPGTTAGARFRTKEMEVMKRTLVLIVAALTLMSASATAAAAGNPTIVVGPGGGTPGTSSNLVLVGHDPLFGRGMNAAMTFYSHYAYVGNRTDGSNSCGDLNSSGPVVPVLT